MIRSLKKHRLKPRMAPDVIGLRTLELDCKKILIEPFDINTNEVDDMIRNGCEVALC